jgi:serine/threonine protein kinase/Tol biopolymer transport system component
MGLNPGTKLGPYEIQSPLGAGGMGEVYRARDTRLERIVAVKILPNHLANDADARSRFEREAHTISALNHPNICVLYDVGVQDGTSYLVMEYVQGETLEARLQKGPLPLKQALECCTQICDALDKAHGAGIVHRDLKPGNIMLTPAGAKLLDFGLAKPAGVTGTMAKTGPLTPSTPTMNLTALTSPPGTLTQQGMVVGTFQYMAPEVLQGQEADARSDIFSFGAVLYEVIAGKRAFEGKSQISVASAILEKDPAPLTQILPMTPPALDNLVQGCLAKEPAARWQSAADIARQLRWISAGGSSSSVAPVTRRGSMVERRILASIIVALLGVLAWTLTRENKLGPVLRSYIPPPADVGFDFVGDFSGPPVTSADGTAIAFCARDEKSRNAIWVRVFSELAARKLDGTEGASFPFWSPDGNFIGFFSDGHLKKVPTSGGPVTILADAPNPRGGSWNKDNVIIFEPDYREPLWRTTAFGDTPVRLTGMEAGKHTTHRWPLFLPDGKHFLFFATSHSGGAEQGIYLGSLENTLYKHVLNADSQAEFAGGFLLYHLQSQLLAQKFDPATGAVSGDPIPLVNFVNYDAGTWRGTFTASINGPLVYEPGSKNPGTGIEWLTRAGKNLGPVAPQSAYRGAGKISPDGKRLAVAVGDPQADIWVFDLATSAGTRLTFGGGGHLEPSWSPDGQRIIYVKQTGSTMMAGTSICSRLANGGGQEETLMDGSATQTIQTLLWPQWSGDGNYLVHTEQSGPVASIWALPMKGNGKLFPVVQPQNPQSRIIQFRLSPDSHWLAYSSTESGREEIYVTHFPSGSGRWQVSQDGGTFPAWRADGRELYFLGFDGMFHVARVGSAGGEFSVEKVDSLFPTGNFTSPVGNAFDVTPDGQRFIFATLPKSTPTPLVMVTNWMADLKK